jgi:hypothetical protein
MFLRRGYGRPLDPCMSCATAMMYANVYKREEVMLERRSSNGKDEVDKES